MSPAERCLRPREEAAPTWNKPDFRRSVSPSSTGRRNGGCERCPYAPLTVPVVGRPCPGRPHDISGRSRTDRGEKPPTDLIHSPVTHWILSAQPWVAGWWRASWMLSMAPPGAAELVGYLTGDVGGAAVLGGRMAVLVQAVVGLGPAAGAPWTTRWLPQPWQPRRWRRAREG